MNFSPARLAAGLEKEIAGLPDDFFTTFAYTSKGRNLTHPIVLGALTRALQTEYSQGRLGIDVRFNSGAGVKFQPDVVLFDDDLSPSLVVDYESPNSSDARIPPKDWNPYQRWAEASGTPAPYVVITTLPNGPAPKWELRWTSDGRYNSEFRGQREQIRVNPFEFWYRHYGEVGVPENAGAIHMLNIDGHRVEVVEPGAI